ncbi:hypothetical protein B0H14DRAFT_82860 [Mycena olivaceomarginata]|nr:hypothetical protein B0H14DRAFT_82860 [Mycena olivaceomarginata]
MSRLTIICLFMLFSVILAAPLDSRTVFAPPITSPTEQSVWKVGQTQTVTWDATGIPAGVMGKIQLGYLDPNSPGEHLSTILATGFNLTDEKVQITVPSVVTRSSYIVVLFGDSGNISPQFTIQGSSSSSASPSSASTSGSGVVFSSASTPAGPVGPPSLSITVTPSPPIATGSSGFSVPPLSTPTAPPVVLVGAVGTRVFVVFIADVVACCCYNIRNPLAFAEPQRWVEHERIQDLPGHDHACAGPAAFYLSTESQLYHKHPGALELRARSLTSALMDLRNAHGLAESHTSIYSTK